MSFGLTADLLIAALAMFIFGLAVCSRVVSLPMAIIVTGAKILLPLVYFAYFFDESWISPDAWTYFENGQVLLNDGYDPFSIFFKGESSIHLMALVGGHHILYDWYNLLAQWIFGSHYYSPVFLNVGLTFGSAFFLYRIAIVSEFSKSYCRGLFLFFLLHWELVAWSSFVNLKDTLVLFMTVVFVYAGIRFVQTKRKIYLANLLALIFIFFWIRFYISLLLMLSIFSYLVLLGRGHSRIVLVFTVGGFLAAYASYVGWSQIFDGVRSLSIGFDTILGALKMSIIPRPWSLDPKYTFLLLPSMLHWIFFIPTVMGVIMLWRDAVQLRVLLVYLLVVMLFYGAFEELLGSRQRVQLIFIYAWAQFHFVWYLLRKSTLKHSALQALR